MADRDLAALADSLVEVQHPLITGMIKTATSECGLGADSGSDVDEDSDDGAIAKACDSRIARGGAAERPSAIGS